MVWKRLSPDVEWVRSAIRQSLRALQRQSRIYRGNRTFRVGFRRLCHGTQLTISNFREGSLWHWLRWLGLRLCRWLLNTASSSPADPRQIVLMVHSLPLHRRALYFSLSSSAVALASILGPLIGGALTTHATWRFCFWINVPPGALVILVIWIWVAVPQQRRHCSDSEDAKSLLERCRELDIPGLLAIVPGMTCLTLVMEMGGTQFPWTDGRAIGLIMAAAVFLTIFILIQYCFPDTSIIPSRIILQRSVFWAAFASFSIGASQSVFSTSRYSFLVT